MSEPRVRRHRAATLRAVDSFRWIAVALSMFTARGLLLKKTRPMASAPWSVAARASSGRVMPHILIRVVVMAPVNLQKNKGRIIAEAPR